LEAALANLLDRRVDGQRKWDCEEGPIESSAYWN
jgi:hypothetical protein